MTIVDTRTLPAGQTMHADVVIIGAGPAGLTLARKLSNTSAKILIIESGGIDFESEPQALNAVENIGAPAHNENAEPVGRGYNGNLSWLNDIAPFELRNRMVGGSSHTWVGKCAAFDETDFRHRPWLPLSGWPIACEDLDGPLDEAAKILNLGPNVYDDRLQKLFHSPAKTTDLDPSLLRSFYWQFSHEKEAPGEPMRFSKMARDFENTNVTILTHATVTDITTDPQVKRVTGLTTISPGGKTNNIKAKTIVLCSGGIENARLLLASNLQAKKGLGNDRDVVGRYLADHPRTTLCHFTGRDIEPVASRFNFNGVVAEKRTHFYLHGVALSPDIQERENLTNCAAYPVSVHDRDDPWAAIKRLKQNPTLKDVATIMRSPHMIATGAYRRLVRKQGLPRKSAAFRFDVMAEQSLDADSRVTLSEKQDHFDMPLAKTNWKIGPVEINSMRRLARIISDEFVRLGVPAPDLADWVTDDDNGRASFMDMAHPSCTTRMGDDVATSVVDRNLMVHGIDGLFVTGSSVFPTPGHANPTLMILALTVRLADHLKERMRQPHRVPIEHQEVDA